MLYVKFMYLLGGEWYNHGNPYDNADAALDEADRIRDQYLDVKVVDEWGYRIKREYKNGRMRKV